MSDHEQMLHDVLGDFEQIETGSNLTPRRPAGEQIETGSNLPPAGKKKTRGRNKSTIKLIEEMRKIAEKLKPLTGRGVGYQLFVAALISAMGEMPKVYRALVIAREEGIIPWDWIVDESRGLEAVSTWANPSDCADGFFYRRDLWQTQPKQCELWSEKGTVRGVLWPVLARLGVGFRVLHGFNSATEMWNVSQQNGGEHRPLVALYCGDWDPSGACMTEVDIPARLREYGGHHVELKRIAVTPEQARSQDLKSFHVDTKGPTATKKGDPRYAWFKKNHGNECWELDAMNPNVLRELVEKEITALIDRAAWDAQEAHEQREKKSIEVLLRWWANVETLRGAASV